MIGLFLFACKKNRSGNESTVRNTTFDSVLIWIQEGRNTGLPIKIRAEKLLKAYETAEAENNDSLKIKYFSRLSLAYLILNDSLNFRNTNREAILLAKKNEDSVVRAEAHWDLAIFFRDRSVEDSAYFHFREAQKIYDAIHNDFHSARMLFNMALVQSDVKDYTGSEVNTIRAIEILTPIDKYKELYRCYNNLGSITIELKEYDRALTYYNEALGYLKKINEKNSLQEVIQNNIGVVYQEEGEHEKAIPYFKQVLKNDSLLYIDSNLYAKSLNNLAYSLFHINKNSDLLNLFNKSIQIQDSIGDISGLSRSHYNLAEYYLSRKDTANAKAQARLSKFLAERSSNNKRLLKTLQLLGRIDPENSFSYTRAYITLNDSLQQEERRLRNKFARIQFETDEFIAENEVLTKQKQIWAAIAFALLLLGTAVYIIVNQRAKNQKLRFQQQQQASNQEIFNMMLSQNQKVEEGKQMEQKRISEELHDGVLGKMLGARMVLTGLNKKEGEEAAIERAKAISALQEVEGEVRSISHELSHAAYQKIHNFMSSIQDLLKSVGQSAKIDCKFVHAEKVDWDGLSGDIKINLYRLVQESLQNAVKHANCEHIVVDFSTEGDHLKVLVKDDGKGFQAKRGRKGIGMRNIASRIEKLEGTWNIESKVGAGTEVRFKIPIRYYTADPEPQGEQRNIEESVTS